MSLLTEIAANDENYENDETYNLDLSWAPLCIDRVQTKWILHKVNKSNSHLVVLIGCHCDELRLREDIGPEGAVRQLEDVIHLHYVEPRLVFVHRVENCLQIRIV